ncbi:MAG: acylneuraminate cytidylyltransferase family protein [Chloroflexi bacterium]|nr:acylneuraminate cytidylyltransferase family protein [Chloroflexota bacterium]
MSPGRHAKSTTRPVETKPVSDLECTVTALVPMRHHSERVPGKNYRLMAGRPLYAYILETLLCCRGVSQIAVDTDSPVIREGVAQRFPSVILIERPEALRGGEVPTNAILEHDLGLLEGEFFLQTHCTNPLLTSATVDRAVEAFCLAFPGRDSLFSVTRWQKRLWRPDATPINHDPAVLLRTQDLPPVFEENSCLYLFERQGFLARGNRLGVSPVLFEIDAREALDIDEEQEFRLVESLLLSGRFTPGAGA